MKSSTIISSQRGMALLISLVFLLLLTLIGISSMQSATLQEKMTSSVSLRNQSFQGAEAALRVGESAVQLGTYSSLAICNTTVRCAPPLEASLVSAAGLNTDSGVTWVASDVGFYGVQNLGVVKGDIVNFTSYPATLFRVTAIGIVGNSRSVVESIYAKGP